MSAAHPLPNGRDDAPVPLTVENPYGHETPVVAKAVIDAAGIAERPMQHARDPPAHLAARRAPRLPAKLNDAARRCLRVIQSTTKAMGGCCN